MNDRREVGRTQRFGIRQAICRIGLAAVLAAVLWVTPGCSPPDREPGHEGPDVRLGQGGGERLSDHHVRQQALG